MPTICCPICGKDLGDAVMVDYGTDGWHCINSDMHDGMEVRVYVHYTKMNGGEDG